MTHLCFIPGQAAFVGLRGMELANLVPLSEFLSEWHYISARSEDSTVEISIEGSAGEWHGMCGAGCTGSILCLDVPIAGLDQTLRVAPLRPPAQLPLSSSQAPTGLPSRIHSMGPSPHVQHGPRGEGTGQKRVPGFPQDMFMPMDEEVARPETYRLPKDWSGALGGMMTLVRVLPPEQYDEIRRS